MKKLSFEEFSSSIAKRIKDYMPEEYASARVETFTLRRLHDSYNALQLVPEEPNKPLPVLNLDMLYEAYYDGMPWEELMQTSAEILQTKSGIDIEKLLDYGYAKEHLLIRVSNWDMNKDIKDEIPYRKLGDIMLTYHVMHTEPDGDVATMRISNEILKEYGITQNQLHEDAVASSQKLLPPVFMTIEDMMKEASGRRRPAKRKTFDEMLKKTNFAREEIYGLTNITGSGGAAVLFYPDVLPRIAEKAASDLYIIPSSIHEVLIALDSIDIDPENLKGIIRSINMEKMMDGIKLADSLYYFSRSEQRLKAV